MNLFKLTISFYLTFSILFHISLFGDISNEISYKKVLLEDQTIIHILKINPSYFNIVLKKADSFPIETVEKIANDGNAIAAINGGFFSRQKNYLGSPIGILKIDNIWYGKPQKPRGAMGWSNQSLKVFFDQVLTYESLDNHTYVIPQSNPSYTNVSDWETSTFIIGGCPILIRNGICINDYKIENTLNTFLYKKHARTAVGILPNNDFLFVVVDGSNNYIFSNTGITIPKLCKVMQSLGCREALNLDGGGSSTMIYNSNIMNSPCGEEYDGNGHYVRSVSDAILVIPKEI